MATSDHHGQFVYAVTSAAPPCPTGDGDQWHAGIAVALKDRQRRPLLKCSYAVPVQTQEAASYEAIAVALREARNLDAGSIAVYADDARVVGQINREAEAKAENAGRYLEVRSLLNQFAWARVRVADPAQCYGLRASAERAVRGLPTTESYDVPPQLAFRFGE